MALQHCSTSELCKLSLRKCLEKKECLQSRAVYFDKHTLFPHCRKERKGDNETITTKVREKSFVLSLLLSNVKNTTEEINPPPTPEKQLQGDFTGKAIAVLFLTSAGAETKALSGPPHTPLPERQNLSDTSQDTYLHCMLQSISVCGEWA